MRVLIALLLCVSLSSCVYVQMIEYPPNFINKSTDGTLKIGIKESEIRKSLGSPHNIAIRKTAVDTRSVWTYREVRPYNHIIYNLLGLATFGIFYMVPGVIEDHYLVLSDGVLIGWDLPDPYAPDLIIEKRER